MSPLCKTFVCLSWILLLLLTRANAYYCIHPSTVRSGASLQIIRRHKGITGHPDTACWLSQPRLISEPLQLQPNESDQEESPQSDLLLDEPTKLAQRERLKNLLRHMRDLLPRMRVCLPAFQARIKSIETELAQEDDDEDFEPESTTAEDETNASEKNDRQSSAASHVDLSGTWRPIVTPEFKQEYDQYLLNCSESYMFRKVIVNGISLQKESIRQLDDGAQLQIVASNPVGNWNRTLVASAEPTNVTIKDPDGDVVQVEAWWEQEGTVHKSWLRDKPRILGGAFETARYLESENVLVCESRFHPSPTTSASKNFKYGHVVWKFKREE
jgi:hypothetical protein